MLKKELQKLLKEKELENNMLWTVINELGIKVEERQRVSPRYFGKIEKNYLFEINRKRCAASLLLDETNENQF